MKEIIILLALSGMCSAQGMFAQNESDILRYTNTHQIGSARYQALGGAMGALGADFSCLSTNPAGLARYKDNEFSLSLNTSLTDSESSFGENKSKTGTDNFAFSNLGIVGVSKAAKDSPYLWKSVQFGFGYNQLANFNQKQTIQGLNFYSLSYVWAQKGQGIPNDQLNSASPFGASLAWETYLIDPDSAGTGYVSVMNHGYFDHEQETTMSGTLGEYVISVASNYNDKIYIGGTIGFPKARYEMTKRHTETSQDATVPVSHFTYNETLRIRANGINFKGGIIALPKPWLRLGLAVHSPTKFYYAHDSWQYSLYSVMNDMSQYDATSPNGSFVYKMRTPGKAIASAAIIIKGRGLVSVDYEASNFSRGRLMAHPISNDQYSFTSENQSVQDLFAQVNTLRIGGEYRLTKKWMLRGGFQHRTLPYQFGVTETTTPANTYSGGFGYRGKAFFLDFSYAHTSWKEDYYMYDPVLVDNSPIDFKRISLLASVGFKW